VPLVYNELLRHLPARGGTAPRRWWLERHARAFGRASSVGRGCRVLGVERLEIGAGVTVARDALLDARGGLAIDDEALIGFESILLTHTHRSAVAGTAIQRQGMYDGPVSIGARAWIGMRAMVLPGVRVGEDAIVAAGAVVTRDVAPLAVVAGAPARSIRMRSPSGG
jgi:maltose O-acetyltransferase